MADRQNKLTEKTRFELLLENRNFDFVCQKARESDLSMGAYLNKIIREMRCSS